MPGSSWRTALWRADGQYRRTIRLANQLLIADMDVRVTLYMADGTPDELPAVRLAKGAVGVVDISDALSKAPELIQARISDFGSAAVSYRYDWQGAVYSTMSILNVPRSLEYTPPFTFSTPGTASESTAIERHVLQGLWWKHFESGAGFVAIANTTDGPVTASVRGGGASETTEVSLPPHGSVLRRLPELLVHQHLILVRGRAVSRFPIPESKAMSRSPEAWRSWKKGTRRTCPSSAKRATLSRPRTCTTPPPAS